MNRANPNGDPNRPLTPKQTRFAAAIAEGKSRRQAYKENYKCNPGFEQGDYTNAKELAKKPHVAAEIRRLVWLTCPPADDIRGMREHSIRVLSDLSRTAKSEETRLKAALALYRIAETTRAAAAPSASTAEQDRLLDRLRELYRTVQGITSTDKAKPAPPAVAAVFDKQDLVDPLPNLPVIPDEDEAIDIQDFTVDNSANTDTDGTNQENINDN